MIGDDGVPRPPPDLNQRRLPVHVLPTETQLYRFHDKRFDPFFFDRASGGRFNAGDGTFGVMYVAIERRGAFAETFLRNVGSTAISGSFVDSKACAVLNLHRPFRAVRFRGYGLAPIGATATLCSSPSYETPQEWSRALHAHPDRVDGILYASRHDDEQLCVAVFDRAINAFSTSVRAENLRDQAWFYELMDLYQVGLLPDD